MKNEITTATTLLRQLLLERGVTEFPEITRATRHESYNTLGDVSEVWLDVDFRRIHVPLETFTPQAYTNKNSTSEWTGSEFMNEQCEHVRFGVETIYHLQDSDREVLRSIGKIQTVVESNEYDTLVC